MIAMLADHLIGQRTVLVHANSFVLAMQTTHLQWFDTTLHHSKLRGAFVKSQELHFLREEGRAGYAASRHRVARRYTLVSALAPRSTCKGLCTSIHCMAAVA